MCVRDCSVCDRGGSSATLLRLDARDVTATLRRRQVLRDDRVGRSTRRMADGSLIAQEANREKQESNPARLTHLSSPVAAPLAAHECASFSQKGGVVQPLQGVSGGPPIDREANEP